LPGADLPSVAGLRFLGLAVFARGKAFALVLLDYVLAPIFPVVDHLRRRENPRLAPSLDGFARFRVTSLEVAHLQPSGDWGGGFHVSKLPETTRTKLLDFPIFGKGRPLLSH
jgi:hypothetical protein